jgi:K+-transporting ATPase KdpF subunit
MDINAGPDFHRVAYRFLRVGVLVRALLRARVVGRLFTVRRSNGSTLVNPEYIISGIIALLLLGYLAYALLRPERF